MDTSLLTPAPYFDTLELRHELTSIFRAHDETPATARPAILARLKVLVDEARSQARRQLEADGNGRRCAEGLSRFQDELIHLIYDYAVNHVYYATNPSDAERMAVVATGGYGRGLLAPGSDIDLLFLLPYKQTAWGESVVEYMLYLLWDLSFKVGHATRSVDQCLKLSLSDMTIRTSILDARLIFGAAELFEELAGRFRHELVPKSGREFIAAKLAERDERHKRSGNSRYLVEPNIKDGKGGLRDLHTLHWLAAYLHGSSPMSPGEAGIFTSEEVATYRKCEDFLWTVRCNLHFLTGRAEERLGFDVQPAMALLLGYTSGRGLKPAERFMKHYFLTAKNVGDLTRILCSALEVQQLKSTPRLNRLFDPRSWRPKNRDRNLTDFKIENGRLTLAHPHVFELAPVNLIRIFAAAEAHNVQFHPEAIRLIRRSLYLIDDKLRTDPEANRVFLELLTSPQGAEPSLRAMNEAGVLARFMPEFRPVVCMMQFNMYHHYTVDEHSIRSIGMLSEIEQQHEAAAHPLSTKIFATIQHRRALYVAMFLHDVGKGRKEDHCLVGANIARVVCPRLGLTPAETETVVWLVEHHLDMSMYAQSRDLNDPKTISDFVAIVQSPERLKLLLVLTTADIRAVGPGVWNGWKGQLLRSLYYEAEPGLTGGHTQLGHGLRIAAAQDALRSMLQDWPGEEVERFIARHYPDYWLRTETRKQVEHAALFRKSDAAGQTLATEFTSNDFHAVTELTVIAPNHARLLALFAGACAAAGANIVGAQITTTRDGIALDTFLLQRDLETEEDEQRRAGRITRTIDALLQGKSRLKELMARKQEMKGRIRAFTVEPEVVINNQLSDRLTVIEMSGLDRPGLLYDLTSAISDLNLDINSAHITTFGEKAVDVFYVTDLLHKKIESIERQQAIRDRLTPILAGAKRSDPEPVASPGRRA